MPCLFFGGWLFRGLMSRSLLSLIKRKLQWAVVNKFLTSDVCFACLVWLYKLFVGTFLSLTHTPVAVGPH